MTNEDITVQTIHFAVSPSEAVILRSILTDAFWSERHDDTRANAIAAMHYRLAKNADQDAKIREDLNRVFGEA